MVENKDLKCFVGTAKNGAKYRACLPKTKKPYKKQQDLRGNPHAEGKRKQPRQLAYPDRKSKAQREAGEKKAGVDSERAKIIRRWQKKIDKETTKEGKEKMSVARNKVLAKYEAKLKKAKPAARPVPKVPVPKRNPKLKILTKEEAEAKRAKRAKKMKKEKKEEPKKKKLKIKKSGAKKVAFTTKDGKSVSF